MSNRGFGAKGLILWAVLLSVMMLPFIGTLNDLMAKVAASAGLDVFIEEKISPQMAAFVAALLTYVFKMEAASFGPSVYLMDRYLPYKLLLNWNCVGWQSLLLLLFSLVAGLQGSHSRLSKVKCILLGLLGVVLLNLFRIAADALILRSYGPGVAIAFHDYATLPLTFLWLAAFWYISTNYILSPRGAGGEGVSLKAVVDFLRGRRTLSVASMAIILLSTFLGGLGILSTKVSADDDPTRLSFEWFPNPVTVCTISTNRVMTHPDYTDLNDTAYEDSYTASSSGLRRWEFYLYGPLEEDYTMTGWIKYHVWLRSSAHLERSRIVYTIYDVDEDGSETQVRSDTAPIILQPSASAYDLMVYHSDSYTFEEGHTIKLGIDLYVRSGRTYTLEYDAPYRWSYLQLPGIVVSENALGLLFLAPLLPRLMAKIEGEEDEED
ncbi:MAG: Exosortase EpsH-related protein [Candidatus Bathyarchaeota archaeon B23]|nr:MAG: Exosortase EpsH-related protein [Candidatus Bathyarchaeota archaeon B23]